MSESTRHESNSSTDATCNFMGRTRRAKAQDKRETRRLQHEDEQSKCTPDNLLVVSCKRDGQHAKSIGNRADAASLSERTRASTCKGRLHTTSATASTYKDMKTTHDGHHSKHTNTAQPRSHKTCRPQMRSRCRCGWPPAKKQYKYEQRQQTGPASAN